MTQYSSPQTRLASRLVTCVCGVLFACFSFCYLYFYQSGYLAQFQYHFSHGETTYQPLVGAVLITLFLLLVGFLCQRALRWPLRQRAVAWFPPAFLLAAVTSARLPELPGYGTGTPALPLLRVLLAFCLVLLLCLLPPDATGERAPLSAYLSSNLFILCMLFLMTGLLGYSSVPGHRELRVGQLLHEGKYAQAVDCYTDTAGLTPRFFALRAAALAHEGKLGECLFAYPVPAGVHTLMPAQSDSLFVYDALPALYSGMRAVPRRTGHFRERDFLRKALLADSLPRPLALEYLLCSHLLHGDLRAFAQLLPLRHDTLPATLPRHYREALVLCRHFVTGAGQAGARHSHQAGAAWLHGSPEAAQAFSWPQDKEMETRYRRYRQLRMEASHGDLEAADSLSAYDGTYWQYYASHY